MPRNLAVRRQAAVEKLRQPAPPGYGYTPKNREQRRRLARELRRAAVRDQSR